LTVRRPASHAVCKADVRPPAPKHCPAGPEDPDLALVVAWPELPEAIRRAVLALVGSAE
jgi:hypothetical protein